jgi:hypothetical protein
VKSQALLDGLGHLNFISPYMAKSILFNQKRKKNEIQRVLGNKTEVMQHVLKMQYISLLSKCIK